MLSDISKKHANANKIEDQNVFFHIELLSLMKVDNFKIEDLKDLDASDVLS